MIASQTYTYLYRCWKCGLKHRIEQDTQEEQTELKCSDCGRSLLRINQAPGLMTDSTFMSGVDKDDGFGECEWLRKKAKAKARAAGVDTNGARYCPQLCDPGEQLSPKAWVKSRADVARRAKELGCGVSGAVTVEPPTPEPKDPTPYVASDKVVGRRVESILSRDGQTAKSMSKKEYKDLWHREQKLASGAE